MKVCKTSKHNFNEYSDYCTICGLRLDLCFINFQKSTMRIK